MAAKSYLFVISAVISSAVLPLSTGTTFKRKVVSAVPGDITMSHAGLSESVTHTKPIPDLSVRIPLTICADLIHACHNFLYLPMDWYSMRFPILFSHNHPDSSWPPGLGDQAPAGTRPWSPDPRWPQAWTGALLRWTSPSESFPVRSP